MRGSPMISRRAFGLFAISAAVGVSCPVLANAQSTDFKSVFDQTIWRPIEAGEFGIAAERLERNIADTPHEIISPMVCGILRFAAGDFAKADYWFANKDWLKPSTKPISRVHDGLLLSRVVLIERVIWQYFVQLRHDPSAIMALTTDYRASQLLSGKIDLQKYVEESTEYIRFLIDAQILNIAPSEAKNAYVEKQLVPYQQRYRCVGSFALGEQALGRRDSVSARSHFADAVATGADNLIEYQIAKAELAKLG